MTVYNSSTKLTCTPAVVEKVPIVLTYLQFQMKVCFWCCLFLYM